MDYQELLDRVRKICRTAYPSQQVEMLDQLERDLDIRVNTCVYHDAGNSGNLRGHWVATYWDSEGKCVIGKGATEPEARTRAQLVLKERERFITLPPEEKLREICNKDKILDTDMQTAIRSIAAILLK